MINTCSLEIRRRFKVCTVVLACIVAVGYSIVEKNPFYCLGTEICNRNVTDWQYCDEIGEERCRLCSKDENTCFVVRSTVYCTERLIEIEKVKGCPPFDQTTHGNHNGSGKVTSYGKAVQLECEAGYQCDGSCTVTCGEFGRYSGTLSCTAKRCPPLLPPRNGYHSPVQHDYRVDEQVRIRCNEGFDLEGDASATCTANGTWSITEMAACARPLEQERRCPPLLPPRNGYHSPVQHDYRVDEQVRIRCNEGFRLEGDARATCTANGIWSITEMAACARLLEQAKRCPPLLPPRNGYHSPVQHDYRVDEQVRIRCNEGFDLEGNASATCTANGTWSITEMAACARLLEQGNTTIWMDFGFCVIAIVLMCIAFVMWKREHSNK